MLPNGQRIQPLLGKSYSLPSRGEGVSTEVRGRKANVWGYNRIDGPLTAHLGELENPDFKPPKKRRTNCYLDIPGTTVTGSIGR